MQLNLSCGRLLLSATDLANHLGCRHLTQLERAVAEGRCVAPIWRDPVLESLQQRGREHEAAFQASLTASGRSVVEIGIGGDPALVCEAMQAGVDVIAQVPMGDGLFRGVADFLLKVPGESKLGPFGYEVVDTKLARATRAGTILQLSLYSELVAAHMGTRPKWMHVVKPGKGFERESFRCSDFAAYYRLARARLGDFVTQAPDATTYPDPVPHCEICRWWSVCDARRRDDDHLSLVAGMTSLHAAEFIRQGRGKLQELALVERALAERPPRGRVATYERLQRQARIQFESRQTGERRFELLAPEEGRGFRLLPEPCPGDVFFDIEAARFYEDGGLEYLLGWCVRDDSGGLQYFGKWARNRDEERLAFEGFVEFVMERWRTFEGMHVYHYAPYEPAALKRMMGRHASCEIEMDRLLRGRRLVDLHAIAKQSIRASVEQYSLKDLELFAGFVRTVDLREASRARRRIEAHLELHGRELAASDVSLVEGYNREDCEATAELRDWLELLRGDCEAIGREVPRPPLLTGDAAEGVTERQAEVQAVFDALVARVPGDREVWNSVDRATWLLAQMLDYHRREMNCAHWEFFRLHGLDEWECLEERKTIAGLEFVGAAGGTARCPVHRYRFTNQEIAADVGDKLFAMKDTLEGVGEIVGVDLAQQTIDIKKRQRSAGQHPRAVVIDGRVSPWKKAKSLLALAESVAKHGVDGGGPFRAARDLLLQLPPRRLAAASEVLRAPDEESLGAAIRLAGELDHGCLPVQGPPGSGKTFAGARMIASLAARGKRVGVTAVSHKVIRNLLDEVLEAGRGIEGCVSVVHKIGSNKTSERGRVLEVKSNAEALHSLDDGCVVGGTPWLWSADDAVEALDYIFVDEAGQMALADVLAVGRSARNIVLLGDPQQLEQPQQGSHPDGSDAAALVHVLNGKDTIPEDKGLFLDTTWRLHPAVCRFTSELFYEDRLRPRAGNEMQTVNCGGFMFGAGLVLVEVQHRGNQSSSPEEVEAVRLITEHLLGSDATWTDRTGATQPLTEGDILIVTPYNAQIAALQRAMPNLRIGTVDKFQGQEAPVVIYSMASSSVEDAPRGMDFLYNPNRLNVATSRARALCVVVASPRLFEPECRSPEQMRWANGLCRYRELATVVALGCDGASSVFRGDGQV